MQCARKLKGAAQFIQRLELCYCLWPRLEGCVALQPARIFDLCREAAACLQIDAGGVRVRFGPPTGWWWRRKVEPKYDALLSNFPPPPHLLFIDEREREMGASVRPQRRRRFDFKHVLLLKALRTKLKCLDPKPPENGHKLRGGARLWAEQPRHAKVLALNGVRACLGRRQGANARAKRPTDWRGMRR